MGIKFHCPNGHKLNVKSFLAGRRGICPDCGAKFEIPSAPEHDDGDGEGSHVDLFPAAAPTPAVTAPAPAMPRSPAPQMAPAGAGPTPHMPAMPRPQAHMPGPMVAPVMAPAPSYAPAMQQDPLTEAPQANWYVRPPSGGQYGPAQGDMVRRWIGEGRLTAESWVWREGWPDWQPAAQVLAMHFAPAQAPAPFAPQMAPSQGGFNIGAIAEPSPLARPHGTHGPRRRSNKNMVVIATVVLAVLTVIASIFAVIYIANLSMDQ